MNRTSLLLYLILETIEQVELSQSVHGQLHSYRVGAFNV